MNRELLLFTPLIIILVGLILFLTMVVCFNGINKTLDTRATETINIIQGGLR